ncbi:UDP-N-acetylmuramoyl-tripeptide--D-alanyl-D-alanine ligase [Gryllotalpicola sp.]|uniref:UDP-N-acetylmuramoyl-tripeptide--D-alanyl-D- alanine ligase n=1 Tax=Gryllotalpicola sp. TaxID=1932787 RepID=UPI002627CF1D|nr:UDP-N-acetylmuramoyl-tripeptide--D-alanyl-D-alanine ligase [Gryllotalpicola sp.]
MIPLPLSGIAAAVSGRLVLRADVAPETIVDGPSTTDSREVVAGGIFFAKRGEVTDGHLFAPQAVERGAALLVVERELDLDVPQVVVGDTVTALGALAKHIVAAVRALGRLTVVAVTGSNGKTTTKNLLRSILSEVGSVVAPRGSLNNEVGAPITMLQVDAATDFLVAEYGAGHLGEIAHLVSLARPDVAIVLKVGLAHVGEFGGVEAIFRAKSEMVTALREGDIAVLNIDDRRVAEMAPLTRATPLWFGLGPGAQVTAREIEASAEGTVFTLVLPDGESAPVRFRVLGEHHVMNALAAAAASHALGVPIAAIVAGLEAVTRAERWRMEVLGGRDGVVVVNDAYNASPDSMTAALRTLATIKKPGHKTIAVLGTMAELGEHSGEAHDQVGLDVVVLGIDRLVVVGPDARRMHVAAQREGTFFSDESQYVETVDEAYALVMAMVEPGDTILVKSSNSAGLRFLGDRLGESFS